MLLRYQAVSIMDATIGAPSAKAYPRMLNAVSTRLSLMLGLRKTRCTHLVMILSRVRVKASMEISRAPTVLHTHTRFPNSGPPPHALGAHPF